MSVPLLVIVTFIYLGVAVSEYLAGRWPMAIVYTAYAIANVGLILAIIYLPPATSL